MQTQILLPGRLLLRVLLHPSFPTLTGGGVAPRKRQGSNLRIRHCNLLIRILRIKPNDRLLQRSPCPTVEQITLDLRPIFARNSHIAAIVESLLQGDAKFFLSGELRDPPFQSLMRRPRRNFERVRIDRVRVRRCCRRRCMIDMPAFFTCHKVSLWNRLKNCHPERSGGKRSAAAAQSKDLVLAGRYHRLTREFSSTRAFPAKTRWK